MKFFRTSKSRVRVGPLIYSIYQAMDSENRAALREFVSGASPKHEITAAFPSTTPEMAQAVLSQLQHAPTGRKSVKGAVGHGDGYMFYVTGDFPEPLLNELAVLFHRLAAEAGVEEKIVMGSPSTDQLKELP
jgi:hypothetical protein